jgi:hypothetical protein
MSSSKTIHNDYVYLDKFSSLLKDKSAELAKTSENLIQRLNELNQKGFQDGNFESLSNAVIHNSGNIKKLESLFLKHSEYIDALSKIIKEYYKIEI